MVAYRFCRPDDMPLICRAVNERYNPHFPGAPPLSLDHLKKEILELGVWVSNAMVAREGEEPVGVLIGTKRPEAVLIHKIGVRSDYQRRGHGRHLLTSLSQKLAVLGPPRLIAEVPDDRPELGTFFEACGYRREAPYVDFLYDERSSGSIPEELLFPVTLEEVHDQGLLFVDADASWGRTMETLQASEGSLEGWGIATPEALEAFVLGRTVDPPESCFDLLAWGCRDPARTTILVGLLAAHLREKHGMPVRLARASGGEARNHDLEAMGFRPLRRYSRFAAEAVSV